MRVAVVAYRSLKTNGELVRSWRALGIHADVLTPVGALSTLTAGDVALVRLDVLETLDGVEAGLELVPQVEPIGVRLLNRPHALLGCHDKRETARRLEAAGVPHPRTAWLTRPDEPLPFEPPFVVKPRFGSWGRDVARCLTRRDARTVLRSAADTPWFRRHGAVLQELVPGAQRDLRLLVAAGRVVGAIGREAGPGEWRTNLAVGGRLVQVTVEPEAEALALAAVATVGGDFVGVDMLPLPGGGHVVLELNGAVDFEPEYALPGHDVYVDVAFALGLAGSPLVAA
jgi:RimK family alpha-L-glutamate ligase